MKKGIAFYFGFQYKDVEQLVKDIKEAGFDCVITTADPAFDYQNTCIKNQVRLLKKYGLELSSLHMRYDREELPHFWTDDKIGDKVEKNLKKDIKIAKKYGFNCVVVHLRGVPNKIGYKRLHRVLKLCEKCDIPIAIENTHILNCVDQVLADISHPYLKFCYDSGHNHCFNGDQDYLIRYKDRLAALHLHDNLGANPKKSQLKGFTVQKESLDMHTLNKYGSIDWQEIAKQLAQVEAPINLDYEILMVYRKEETAKEVLKEVYKQACELETMINKYKDK